MHEDEITFQLSVLKALNMGTQPAGIQTYSWQKHKHFGSPKKQNRTSIKKNACKGAAQPSLLMHVLQRIVSGHTHHPCLGVSRQNKPEIKYSHADMSWSDETELVRYGLS